ncbi:hypothetical protein KI387_037481, partial [Taxus chinensis]
MADGNEDFRQKAGDILPPCKACTEICNRIHGKQKEKESSGGPSYFFKVMLGDFGHRLVTTMPIHPSSFFAHIYAYCENCFNVLFISLQRIPPAFVKNLIKETYEDMALEGPSGHQWIVKLWRGGTEMEFRQGWESFVRDHEIALGEFLVFKYICRSYFQVMIFGKSACEKKLTVFEPGKINSDLQKRCPASFQQPINSMCPLDLVYDQKKKNVRAEAGVSKAKSSSNGKPRKKLGHLQPSLAGKKHQTPKSAEPKNEEKSYQQAYFVSCRRPVAEAERKKALEDAKSFTSNKPFCLLLMKPSNVYQGFWLNIPRNCGDRLGLPRERTELTLVDPNNKEWDVKYLGDRHSPGLSGGWRSLTLDNNLEEGDVCILERVDESKNKIKIRVHVYRVVKKWTPYKKMEGRGIIDSTEIPMKPNKKMKSLRENVAINLTAKVFEQNQGKDAKQVPVKKEKVINGSNCHKLGESKCTFSISESLQRSPLREDMLTVESAVQ